MPLRGMESAFPPLGVAVVATVITLFELTDDACNISTARVDLGEDRGVSAIRGEGCACGGVLLLDTIIGDAPPSEFESTGRRCRIVLLEKVGTKFQHGKSGGRRKNTESMYLSLIHISEPTRLRQSRMPSSA